LLIMGVNVQRWQELRGVADGSARTPSRVGFAAR